MKRTKRMFLVLFAVMAMMMSLTAIVSADTADEYFEFTVNSSSGTYTRNGEISNRTKSTDTKVYVYLTKAPYSYIQVKTWGRRQTASTYYNETKGGYATVQKGVQCSITNYIYEHANYQSTKAYITLKSAGSGGTVSGCWSPDSSKNYTIVN